MKLVHNSPQGALEIVGVPGAIEPGEPFEVSEVWGEGLLVQSELFRRATKADEKAWAEVIAARVAAEAKAAEEGAGE